MSILGYDCNGRPLRAGDEVVIIRADNKEFIRRTGLRSGDTAVIAGLSRKFEGNFLLDGLSLVSVRPNTVMKIDNHQPAGSFDEVMAGLKNKEPDHAQE